MEVRGAGRGGVNRLYEPPFGILGLITDVISRDQGTASPEALERLRTGELSTVLAVSRPGEFGAFPPKSGAEEIQNNGGTASGAPESSPKFGEGGSFTVDHLSGAVRPSRPIAPPAEALSSTANTVRFDGGRVLFGDHVLPVIRVDEGGTTRIEAPGPHFMELLDIFLLLRDQMPAGTKTATLFNDAARAYGALSVITNGRRDLIERMFNQPDLLATLLTLMRQVDSFVDHAGSSSDDAAWHF